MNRGWIIHEQAIKDYMAHFQSQETFVGGRLVFIDYEEESKFLKLLRKSAYVTSDSGECEIVANKAVVPSNEIISELIEEFRSFAKTHNLRLLAVEGGNIDEQPRWVLASEENYIPWWEE